MKIGTKLRSQACDGEVVVIRAEGVTDAPEAGGVPMILERAEAVTGEYAGEGFALGKRYELIDEAAGVRLELLVTKPGTSTLTFGGRPLAIKQSKPLPSSD